MRRFNTCKGFTILEMIISVAVLSIISVFVLQLFISARNMSDKARHLDWSIQMSKTLMESIKSCEKPEDLYTLDFLKESSMNKDGRDTTAIIAFDKDLKFISSKDLEKFQEADFLAILQIKPVDNTTTLQRGTMLRININMVKTKSYVMENTSNTSIYSIEADKFFN